MRISLLSIGDEVLYGYTVNTNAAFLAQTLLENGFLPDRHTVLGDDPISLKRKLDEELSSETVVIATGGLGPTLDDWTRKVAAEIFGVSLEVAPGLEEHLKKHFGGDVRTLQDQLLQPKGAHLFYNFLGTASGFALKDEKRHLIALPGVPSEMKELFVKEVIPYLQAQFGKLPRRQVGVFHFCKLKEADVDPLLRTIQEEFPSVACAIYPAYGTLTVHLTGDGEAFISAQKRLANQFQDMRFDAPSGKLSEALHLQLMRKKISLATAESCTGGALAATFVAYPDASTYFQGSIVAYSNASKEKLLSVERQLLDTVGAVSEEVTASMASSVRRCFSTECGIAVSGILGPKGGTVEKPVGTVSVSISLQERPIHSWTMHLKGNRQAILEQAIQQILIELFLSLKINQSNQ